MRTKSDGPFLGSSRPAGARSLQGRLDTTSTTVADPGSRPDVVAWDVRDRSWKNGASREIVLVHAAWTGQFDGRDHIEASLLEAGLMPRPLRTGRLLSVLPCLAPCRFTQHIGVAPIDQRNLASQEGFDTADLSEVPQFALPDNERLPSSFPQLG